MKQNQLRTWKKGDRIRDAQGRTYVITREHEGIFIAQFRGFPRTATQEDLQKEGFSLVTELRGQLWVRWAVTAIATATLVVACKATVAPPVVNPQVVGELTAPQEEVDVKVNIPEYKDGDFVDLKALIPSVVLDMKYATTDNFLGRKVYSSNQCLLRYSVAKRLVEVQQELQREGLGLKVFDCWRPLDVQKQMWKIKPDANYVANPNKGSRHNRGAAVDLTLVDGSGQELEMPTGFDDFTKKAHRDYQGASPQAQANRQLLEQAMVNQGFSPLPTEWWHFDAPNWNQFPVQ